MVDMWQDTGHSQRDATTSVPSPSLDFIHG
jgi:hypothetical protein